MKKKLSMLFAAILFAGFSCFGANYYVSTSGNDGNSGTSTSSPFKTLQKAVDAVSAGDYIYLRGGTYSMTTSSLVITKNGTSSSNIHVYAYSGEVPVLSFDNVENSTSRGIVMEGDYWYWQGVTIEKAGDNGMLLSGNNNTIENCIFRKNHDTGLQLSRYYTDADQISEWPSNNLIVGCEAFDNKDSDNEDADGFAAKLTSGTGNVFRSCVSHHNIDDGWDLYTKSETGAIGIVLFEDCIAHHNGMLTDGVTSGGGDKNGFKLGSSDNTVDHELRRCIAFSNGKHGFTDNGNIGNIKFYNLTSYDNGDYNYHTRDGASHTFRNCITLDGNSSDRIVGDAPTSCNALDDTDFDWQYVVTSSDFQTLTPGSNSDPTSNGFLNLSSSSSLIDAGCTASGVSGNGTLDLGAIEYGGVVDPTTTYTLSTSVSGSGSVSGAGTYNEGTTATVSASAASGWSFSNWSGAASGTSTSASVYMDGNKSVTAVFIEDGGTTDPVEGDVIHNFTESGLSSDFFSIVGNLSTSKGTETYDGLTLTQCLKIESSTSISFTSAQEGTMTFVFNSTFSGGFNVDGTSQNVSSGILTVNLAAGTHTLTKDETANLYYMSLVYEGGTTPTTFALTTTINGSGSVNPSSGTYDAGTSVSMTATPASGWQFDSWSGGSTSNPATVVMDADKNITANFSQLTTEDGTISLTANAGNAQVDLAWTSSNIASSFEVYRDLDSDPTGRVRIATVAATSYSDATVSNGTTYYYWIKATDVNGTVVNSNVAQATPQGDVTTYALTTTIVGSGSIDPSSGTYAAGTSVSMTATPASGWQFDSWSGGSTSNPATVVMDADKNITANFAEIQSAVTVTIQENATGFCSVDGTIDNNNAGFTGDGFANTNNSSGSGINWAIDGNGGSYTFRWNYANGSTDNRSGILYINGSAVSTEDFVSTDAWTTWTTTSVTISNVPSGNVTVRLEANTSLGLANIDYLEVTGSGVSAGDCGVNPNTYTVSTSVSGSGSVSGAGTYSAGSTATLTASPSSGYQFDNWSGSASGTSNPLAITVNSDLSVTANFSEVTNPDVNFAMIGYATVNADGYSTTTGGEGGTVTTVSTLDALQSWASDREGNTSPAILYISGKISASSTTVITVKHGANVSILGLGSTAELQNVGLNIWDYENVIVRNLKIHEVFYPEDALTIDACNHVWVDHCEMHSIIGGNVTVDTYDGLLDIKRGSKYVTVSWCHFHDHMKTMLIGHTDNTSSQAVDSEMRITLHHNYHQNTDGRNPSVRFGAVHMFNNYFNTISDYGLASRVGAHVKVENCHYNDVVLSMSTDKFPVDGLSNGYICQSGNIFTGSTGAAIISQTGCDWWSLPYSYTLDAVGSVASTVPANVGVGKIASLKAAEGALALQNVETLNDLAVYPNPFSESTTISFKLAIGQEVSMHLYDMTGRLVDVVQPETYSAGKHEIVYNNASLSAGMYLLKVQTESSVSSVRLLVD